MPRKTKPSDASIPELAISGSVWLQSGSQLLGGADRVALLEAIHETGSMTRAAKAVGISYVTAWDRVQDMNNAMGQALVHRTAGGRSGGGTVLTAYALELIFAFRQIEQVHAQVLKQLTPSLANPGEVLKSLSRLGLRTSARNQLAGTISRIRAGNVDAMVELILPGTAEDKLRDTLRISITAGSVKALGLSKGMPAVALFKAPAVHLALPDAPEDLAMQNSLRGRVTAIQKGPVRAEVHVGLQSGQTLVSMVDAHHVRTLRLVEGSEVLAQFHDHAIILGVI